jgi:glycosyltransferase involved in cell wall biosynthesis
MVSHLMPKALHICFVCDEYPPAPHGGTGSSYRDLAEGLVAAEHKVTVIGVYAPKRFDVGEGKDEMINGVRVVRLPGSKAWLRHKLGALADRKRLTRWLTAEHKKTPFHLVEASDYGGWLRYGGPPGVPTVVRIRGSNLFFDTELQRPGDPFEHKLEREALARASSIGSVSRYAATRTLEICGLADRECTVIYNAVDTDLFSPSPKVKREDGLIVFVNSINPKKGIEQLIDAMGLLWPLHPELRLAVIGQDTQKSEHGMTYTDRLLDRVHGECRPKVRFHGRLDRAIGVVDFLRRAHICCYPSHMETFGIAALEAMSVGKPTIFSRTGPGPEVIEDGISGLLCDPTNPGDIAQKILRLLTTPKLAQELGRNARKRVEDYFDKRHWVERNVEFFRKQIKAGTH